MRNWKSFCWICGGSRSFIRTSAGFWDCEECGMAKSDGQIRNEQRSSGAGKPSRGRRRSHTPRTRQFAMK